MDSGPVKQNSLQAFRCAYKCRSNSLVAQGHAVVRSQPPGEPRVIHWPTHFTLTIEVKDGRARATFSDMSFVVTIDTASKTEFLDTEYELNHFGEEAGFAMLASLEFALKKGPDDW